ncbi:hypothetical protein DVH24_017541 [Malus domestica]|uniref:Pentacotripeptide-repeat region of PRORP domain-containing protein n=1 Tax=Malus domestica TaxID=3750 RepID=A0A498IT28_MALDO|nr:hypothetical protein DVH24_032756 [Malus domestica]RXI09686.1 hypothetical protein DVH24_017541 [Malus domestica]
MGDVKKIFDLMLNKGSMVTAYSCNILINGYCKHRRINEAMMLFKEMSRSIVIPDVVTYSTLVEGFCKLGKIHDA